MRKTKSRVAVALVCEVCAHRNYQTTKSATPRETGKRLSLRKYCPECKTRTEHKESR